MDTVIDSVSINRLLKPPPKGKPATPLDPALRSKRLCVIIDPDRAIVHEWAKTSSDELVKLLVAHWEQWGAIRSVGRLGKVHTSVAKSLRQLGFGTDTIDKLLLRVALGTLDKVITSDDGDFWHPQVPATKCVGVAKSPVCKICHVHLGITILSLRQLCIAVGAIR